VNPFWRRVFMAADYTEGWGGHSASPDDRSGSDDERRFEAHRYVNAAQRSGRPSASRIATRGRPV
jgi:hypothetical protein